MDRKKVLPDIIPNIGFNLKPQETFIKDHGIVFEHWSAIPSPIGLKDRGDYRRPDTLDTFSSNGYIYKKTGEFTALMVSNNHSSSKIEAGLYDNSSARLILPKHYDSNTSKEISLLPGDRIYAKHVQLTVENYQRVDHSTKGPDILQFPANEVSILVDSQNITYKQNQDFKINADGNIQWLNKKNPGIDPDTGFGRVYSIRYKYIAFWYIHQLLNEIRITNNGTSASPTRMAYHAVIMREYNYHNKTQNASENQVKEKVTDTRKNIKPQEEINPQSESKQVKVNIKDFDY